MNRTSCAVIAASFALAASAGCGDAPTSDERGFTKAPLETLGIFIESETRSNVRAFARFNIPNGERITPPAADSAGR